MHKSWTKFGISAPQVRRMGTQCLLYSLLLGTVFYVKTEIPKIPKRRDSNPVGFWHTMPKELQKPVPGFEGRSQIFPKTQSCLTTEPTMTRPNWDPDFNGVKFTFNELLIQNRELLKATSAQQTALTQALESIPTVVEIALQKGLQKERKNFQRMLEKFTATVNSAPDGPEEVLAETH